MGLASGRAAGIVLLKHPGISFGHSVTKCLECTDAGAVALLTKRHHILRQNAMVRADHSRGALNHVYKKSRQCRRHRVMDAVADNFKRIEPICLSCLDELHRFVAELVVDGDRIVGKS